MGDGATDIPPPSDIEALLETDWVTPATRQALHAKLDGPAVPATPVLDPDELALLTAVVERLVPQVPGRAVPIAATIHANLAAGRRDGWRYDDLPPDVEAYRLGLRGVAESARVLFACDFVQLQGADQDVVLAAIEDGWAPSLVWASLSSIRFFEELLAEAVEIFAGHPFGQELMGYRGMADARGFRAVGLNRHDPVDVEAPDASA